MSSQSSQNNNTLRNYRFFLFAFLALAVLLSVVKLLIPSSVNAETQPPAVINYQGKVLENGVSVTTTKEMGFVLFDSKTGGNRLYTASGTLPSNTGTIDITPNQGIFNVELGSGNTNSLDPSIFQNNDVIYLQVYIEGNKLSPRKRMTSQPFAMNAQYLMGHSATSTPTSTGYVPVAQSDGDFQFQGLHVTSSENAASSALKISNKGNTNFNFLSGGKLGINSSSPATNLSIKGDLKVTATSSLGQVQVTGTQISALDDSGLSLFDNNSNGIFIADQGNVGINTTSPRSQFVVDGDGLFTGTATSTDLTVENKAKFNGSTEGISLKNLSNTSTIAFTDQTQTFSKKNTFNATTTLATTTLEGKVLQDVDDAKALLVTQEGNGGDVFVVDTKNNEITASGTFFADSGLNTNSGDLALNSASGDITLQADLDVSGKAIKSSNNGNIIINPNGTGKIGINTTSPDTLLEINGDIKNSSTLFTDTANNRVAINTTSPDTALEVNGDISNSSTLFTDVANQRLGVNTSSPGFKLSVNGDGYINSNLRVGNANEQITTSSFNINGNDAYIDDQLGVGNEIFAENAVHVGTSSLHLTGDVSGGQIRMDEGPLSIESQGGTLGFNTSSNKNIITGSGNFGVNSSSPSKNFAVSGTSKITGTSTVGRTLSINSASRRVGINTTSPSKDLVVKGSSKFTNTSTFEGQTKFTSSNAIQGKVNNPTTLGTLKSSNLSDFKELSDVYVSGDYAYVTASSSDALHVVDISDPSTPTSVDKIVDTGTTLSMKNPVEVVVQGGYAYVAVGDSGNLQVLDISDPSNIKVAGSYGSSGVTDLDIKGNYAYIHRDVLDVSDPFNVSRVSSISNQSVAPASMEVSGDYAYIGYPSNDKLEVFDISDPKNPKNKSTIDLNSSFNISIDKPHEIEVVGKYAYLVSDTEVFIFDISDPLNISRVPSGSGSTPNFAAGVGISDIQVAENYAYASLENGRIQVFDISSPSQVPLVGDLDMTGDNKSRGLYISGNTGVVVGGKNSGQLTTIDLEGAQISNANIGNARISNMQVMQPVQFQDNLKINGGLSVGTNGFMLTGDFAMGHPTSSLTTTSSLQFNDTALFSSSVSSSDSGAFVFDTQNDLDKSSNVLTVKENGSSYLDITGTGTTTVYNDFLVGTTTENITTSSFNMNGDDAYINDQLGVGNEIFAENAVHVGTSSLHLTGDISGGKIRMDQGPLSIESQGGKLSLNNNSNKNIITGNGNFGINTTTPDEELTVKGDVNLADGSLQIASSSTSGAGFVGVNVASPGVYEFEALGDIRLGQDSIKINSTTDNVGINTTSPDKQLVIDGTTQADGQLNVSGTSKFDSSASFQATSTFNAPTRFNKANLFRGKIGNPEKLNNISDSDNNTSLSEPVDIDVSGDYAYVVASSSPALQVIDISDPNNPTTTDSIGSGISDFSNPQEVVVRDNYAYIAVHNSNNKNLQVIDISNPSNLKEAGSFFNKAATDIAVKGNYAFLTEPGGTVIVIDVSDPTKIDSSGPSDDQVTTINNGSNPREIEISENYAYIAYTGSDELEISDISDPKNPKSISITGVTLNNPVDIEVSGKYAYIATGPENLEILDISDPKNPESVNIKSLGVVPEDIYVSGRYIYIAEADGNLEIYDAGNDPSSLTQVSRTSFTSQSNQIQSSQILSVHVAGNYGFVGGFDQSTFFTIDLEGADISNAEIGNAKISNLQVKQPAKFSDSLNVNGGLSIGSNGLMITGGDFAMGHATSSLSVTSSLQFNDTAVFESTVSSSDANSFVFDTHHNIDKSSKIFSIRDNGSEIFNINGAGTSTFKGGDVGVGTSKPDDLTANPDIHITDGALCVDDDSSCQDSLNPGDIAAVNTTIQNADLAELYASKQNLKSGELVKLDDNSSGKVKRTSKIYDKGLLGVVSSDPGVLLGSSASGTYPIALSGRVPTKVNDSGGDIHVGDPITASSADGVGMKADHSSQIVGYALESFTGSGTTTINVFISPEEKYNEDEFKIAKGGNIGFGTTTPEYRLDVEGTAQAELFKSSSSSAMSDLAGGLTVGPKGFVLEGGFTMSSANPSISSTNKLNFDSTTLFENSVTSSDDYAYIFNTTNQLGISSSTYLMSIRNNDQPQLSVATNGDVHAGGTLFADGLNTNENDPGDLAEEVSIKPGQSVEPGEVLVVDSDNVDTYRESKKPYSSAVAGVVSTDPSITIGGTKSDNKAVMAMVGRVPTKVTTENGEINRGDLLVSASKPGHAMKYDPSADIDNTAISSVGIALESFSGSESETSTGKIMTLVKSGWISNYGQSITNIKKDITQIAKAKGVNVNNKPSKLTVETSDSGDIEYKKHGNLDLAGNNIVNVSGIRGANNKWSIDTNGRFVTNVKTSQGDKSLYTIQSDNEAYYTFFGTDKLKGGKKEVRFEKFRQDIIDESYPIQVNVTLKSPANGIYVSESSEKGFTVKETGDGESSAKFDWTVIAKRETADSDKSVQPHGGCTNPRATNYDPTATKDDGSCKIAGCLDIKAANYDSTATIGGRIDCVYKESKVVKGCTAKRASNYDPEANLNDGSCNFKTKSEKESEKDTQAPSIELLGAKEVTLEVGDDYNDPGVELDDNRDNSPKLTTKVNGKKVDSLNIDTTEPNTAKVVYKAVDDAGNESKVSRTIEVKEKEEDDGKDPEITLEGESNITLTTDQKYVEPGAKATDKEDGDITDKINKLGSVNDEVAGEYSLVYKVEDSDGNKASVSRVVTIEKVSSTEKKTSPENDTSTTTSSNEENSNSSSETETNTNSKTETSTTKDTSETEQSTSTSSSTTQTREENDETSTTSTTKTTEKQKTEDTNPSTSSSETTGENKNQEQTSEDEKGSKQKEERQTTESDSLDENKDNQATSSTKKTANSTTTTTQTSG